jgi:O-antigen/teichoic acid export membrane protein
VVITFSTLAVLGRIIAPETFGVFALLIAVQTVLLPLIDLGLTPAYVKMEIVDSNVNNAFFTTNFALAIINSIAFIAASFFISEKDIL